MKNWTIKTRIEHDGLIAVTESVFSDELIKGVEMTGCNAQKFIAEENCLKVYAAVGDVKIEAERRTTYPSTTRTGAMLIEDCKDAVRRANFADLPECGREK